MRQLLAAKPILLGIFLCGFLVLAAGEATAAVTPPPSSDPPSTGKRIASRALKRSTSMEWPSDVAARLRLLEAHAERAARDHRMSNEPEVRR